MVFVMLRGAGGGLPVSYRVTFTFHTHKLFNLTHKFHSWFIQKTLTDHIFFACTRTSWHYIRRIIFRYQ